MVWKSYHQDGSTYNIYGQRYASSGAPQGGEFEVNTMTAPYGIDLPDEQPLLHFAARQDVVIWPLQRLD